MYHSVLFNPAFVANITDMHGDVGKAWLENLPVQIYQLCQQWQLNYLRPMPNLTYHFVGLVKLIKTGETAIIKIAPVKNSLEAESRWLQYFKHGVPKLYQCMHSNAHAALLMQRLMPGKTLTTLVKNSKDDAATRVICRLIRELQSQQEPQQKKLTDFKHLSELQGSLVILKNHMDNKLLSKAIKLFSELTHDRSGDVILHGDLHHDNILSCGQQWKAIDPHGYIGDPVFEVAAMIYNPLEEFPHRKPLVKIIGRRLKILSEELNFAPARIQAWMLCRTILSIAWSMEDHRTIPEFDLSVAKAIDQLQI